MILCLDRFGELMGKWCGKSECEQYLVRKIQAVYRKPDEPETLSHLLH